MNAHKKQKTEKPKEAVDVAKRKKEEQAEEDVSLLLEEQIKTAEEEAKKHYDKLLRVMAEFENFKKRIEKEKKEHLQYSNEKLLTEMLPVLDDFDRVLDHIPEDSPEEAKVIAKGIELVHKNMLMVLGKFGLKEIDAMGKDFDPTIHEAISTAKDENFDPEKVISVHRKGYSMGNRLLRAAMVTVNK